MKFTYPFCYVPRPEIRRAAEELILRIDRSDYLKGLFSEGKMMGVLEVEDENGEVSFIYAFSGLAGGRSLIDGFVPPVFDLSDPSGYYRIREAAISAMPEGDEKSSASKDLQEWIFRNYIVMNARGRPRSVLDIFADRGLVPPGGTGDCAAPKLLNYAYRNRLKPLAMGEFWYGVPSDGQVRKQGCFYPSCTGKCGPLLDFMMQGLDVEENPLAAIRDSKYGLVFSDDNIIVADKPSGLLCVPGKTGTESLLEFLQERFSKKVYSCHRLDMDTSGLIVFALDPRSQSDLGIQFEGRQTSKKYVARLTPGECSASGRIELPLAADYYDRPRRIVDFENGKPAVTDYRILRDLPSGESDVEFVPLTGRTHQLRVHAAHPAGLGRPIKGDRLYGDSMGDRLYLHCSSLSFRHPVTGMPLEFTSKIPWELPDELQQL